ncbi:hypothetical protein DXU03_06615 [Rhizobium johnstonii]
MSLRPASGGPKDGDGSRMQITRNDLDKRTQAESASNLSPIYSRFYNARWIDRRTLPVARHDRTVHLKYSVINQRLKLS